MELGSLPNSAKNRNLFDRSKPEFSTVSALRGSFSLALGSVMARTRPNMTNRRGRRSWLKTACQNLMVLYTLLVNMAQNC